MRLAVLMTSHNRRDTTLRCLTALLSNQDHGTDVEVFLVDDGSTDGTRAAVLAAFPRVHVIQSSGELYWSRGMNLAWREALKETFDAFLWLNDDVELRHDALSTLLWAREFGVESLAEDCIIAGCLLDPETSEYSYGVAMRDSTWHPGRWRMVEPHPDVPKAVDSFHGNVVLVPASVVERIGIIDGAFSHSMGDTDYALRAASTGVTILAAPGYVGTCPWNAAVATSLRSKLDRKFVPARDWRLLTRRHSPRAMWVVAFISPYAGVLLPDRFRKWVRGLRAR